MRPVTLPLLLSLLTMTGCAAMLPVAVSCPKSPPAPSALTSPASTGPSLPQQLTDSEQKLEELLKKAQRSL